MSEEAVKADKNCSIIMASVDLINDFGQRTNGEKVQLIWRG